MIVTIDAALDIAGPVVQKVGASDMHAPTPCSDWDVHQLLNHMLYELAWVPELLSGKTIAQVGDSLDGDLIGKDLQHTWHVYAKTVQAAAEQSPPEKVVHLSYGNVPASQYVAEVAGDIVIHTWDLAKGIGMDFRIPEDVAKAIFQSIHAHIGDWRAKGLVGDEVTVPADASAEARLLGLFGRKA